MLFSILIADYSRQCFCFLSVIGLLSSLGLSVFNTDRYLLDLLSVEILYPYNNLIVTAINNKWQPSTFLQNDR